MKTSVVGSLRRVMAVFQVAMVPVAGFVTFEVGVPDVVTYSQAAPRGVARRVARRTARRVARRVERREERREQAADAGQGATQ